jgi:GTPase
MKPVPPVTKTFTPGAYPSIAKRPGHGSNIEVVEQAESRRAAQRALAIAAAGEPADAERSLAELTELLRTAGVATVGEVVQLRSRPDPDRYFGRGKLEEVKAEVGRLNANVVAVDDELLPRQERNLETALEVPVIDRTAVILDIFADHAHSAEGKLQVELAQLEYNLARMRGLWTHLERLGGGIGTRGPGESQIETDRRLARDRIAKLRRRLREVERSRGVMRAGRQSSPLPQVALAGYTNAGKSTLLNAMTGAEVGVGSRLFHTLDPTTRGFRHAGREYLVTDTVGFIRKLPHQLVEAFKATLEETILADLILHVIDASEPEAQRRETMAAVETVLEEIGAHDQPRLLVLNKSDLLDVSERQDLRVLNPGSVVISAATGDGLEDLGDAIEATFAATLADIELLVPYTAGARLAELHELAGEIEREDRPEGVLVHARVPAGLAHRFDEFAVNGSRRD